MPDYDASRAECFVYVYREGMLAAVGHDLKIRVTDFKIQVTDETSVQAEFRADSLRVVGSMKNGRVDETEPSPKDKKDIEATIAKEILEAGKYPTITFRSTSIERNGDRYQVRGTLDLHGASREIQFTAEQSSGRAAAKATLRQPDFNIKPYRAFLGALRIKPEAVVEVSTPLDAG